MKKKKAPVGQFIGVFVRGSHRVGVFYSRKGLGRHGKLIMKIGQYAEEFLLKLQTQGLLQPVLSSDDFTVCKGEGMQILRFRSPKGRKRALAHISHDSEFAIGAYCNGPGKNTLVMPRSAVPLLRTLGVKFTRESWQDGEEPHDSHRLARPTSGYVRHLCVKTA